MDDTTGRATSNPAGDASEAPTDNALPVGTRLHEFEIQRVIGEGGFSLVYLAFDHVLHRTVALKEYIPRALAGRRDDNTVVVHSANLRPTFEAGMRSFINEARLLAQFDHPALVKVYRFWEGNATAYMAMPLYQGRTLKQVLKDDPARATQAWMKKVFAPVQDALALLHAQRCYHRDISPDNIQLLANDAPVLLDFGAARRTISDRTQAFTAILKPSYAPLEQYADDAQMKQGPWTDVYALAAVMYAAITRKPPPPSVARIYQDPMQPLASRTLPGFDAAFLRAIDQALAVRPDERIRSMHAFAEALGMPTPRSAPPPPDESPTRAPGERPDESTLVAAEPAPLLDHDATVVAGEPPTVVALPLAGEPAIAKVPAPDDAPLVARQDERDERTRAPSTLPDERTNRLAAPLDDATRGLPRPRDATEGPSARHDESPLAAPAARHAVARAQSPLAPTTAHDEPTVVPSRRTPAAHAAPRGRPGIAVAVGAAMAAVVIGYAGWRAVSADDAGVVTPTPPAIAPSPASSAASTIAPGAAPTASTAATTPSGATLAPPTSGPTGAAAVSATGGPAAPMAPGPSGTRAVDAAPSTPPLAAPDTRAPATSAPATSAPAASAPATTEPATGASPASAPSTAAPAALPRAREPAPATRPARDVSSARPARERPAAAADDGPAEPPKGGRSAPARPVPGASGASPEPPAPRQEEKCRTLRMRAELGETLTGSDRSALEKECR